MHTLQVEGDVHRLLVCLAFSPALKRSPALVPCAGAVPLCSKLSPYFNSCLLIEIRTVAPFFYLPLSTRVGS